jgi:glycosyltransferase involved in cell wall biosynthesis
MSKLIRGQNVLQILNYSAPYRGNFIQSLLRLEQWLSNDNIQMIYLFCKAAEKRDWVQQLARESKPVYFLSGSKIKDVWLIARLVKKHGIGIIHNHFIGVASISLQRIARKFGKNKFVVIRHLHNPYTSNIPVIEQLKKIVSHVDMSISCSKAVAEDYNMKKKDRRERVVYATNAIDFSRLDNYQPLNPDSLKIEKGAFVLLVFGFDYFRKGVDILIRAVHELIKDGQPVCLIVSLADNHALAEEEIKKEWGGMPAWIRLVPSRNDIATYYKFADAFVSSSRSEGFCYSLVEAAYCGTQLIASDIFAQRDLDIPFTFQYPVNDIKALQKQILSAMAIDNSEKVRRNAIQKEYVLDTFDLDKWATDVIGFYRDAMQC